jgi:hypothetical protein
MRLEPFQQTPRSGCERDLSLGATGAKMVAGQQRPVALPADGGTAAPKLGPHDRKEIGRALEAMYDEVVRQGVPARVADLLDGLDARTRGDGMRKSAGPS